MKKFFLTLSLIGLYSYSYSQSNMLSFEYDAAGNQTLRELVCVNCDTPSASRPANALNQQTEDLSQIPEDKISYYPNPVLEQLQIKWLNTEERYVNSIEVYSMGGQLVGTNNKLENNNSTSLEFQHLAQGIYNIILLYNNGDKKTIKVIKK